MVEEALLGIERVWLIHDLFPGPAQSRTSRSAILYFSLGLKGILAGFQVEGAVATSNLFCQDFFD